MVRTLVFSPSHTHPLTLSHPPSLSHPLAVSLTHSLALSHTLSLTQSLSHTLSHTLSQVSLLSLFGAHQSGGPGLFPGRQLTFFYKPFNVRPGIRSRTTFLVNTLGLPSVLTKKLPGHLCEAAPGFRLQCWVLWPFITWLDRLFPRERLLLMSEVPLYTSRCALKNMRVLSKS